ncbi:MAG: citramalate synthase [Verrucomicrobia bacterium]|nr:citramalate synthase [Verrucomicrobiota bacterium]
MSSAPHLTIYDTTLRDGAQGEGVHFSLSDKLRLAERLASYGLHYVEGGWPGSNDKDRDFFAEAKKLRWTTCKLAAFGSTRRPNTETSNDSQVRLLLEAETPVVTIFGKSWLLHVEKILRTTPTENLRMISDTIALLKKEGREAIYDDEHFFDGYSADSDYALRTLEAAAEAGADYLVLCETNGGRLPSEISTIVRAVQTRFPKLKLGIHTHNDCGLGVANAVAAVQEGALQVQGTINGYGERTGNCNLTTLLPLLELKLGKKVLPQGNLRQLSELSAFVDELANLHHDPRAPFVGRTAFAHKGGMHVNAVNKLAASFEHIEPASVGNSQRILVGELSGGANVMMKARELGVTVDEKSAQTRAILARIKKLEKDGYEFEAADASFELLVRRSLEKIPAPFQIESYEVKVVRSRPTARETSHAKIAVRIGKKVQKTSARGDGPVNALDAALRKALLPSFPSLRKMKLIDYKVRIVSSRGGTAARIRVLVESSDGAREWGTVGVSTNILEASALALTDSLSYFLLPRPT